MKKIHQLNKNWHFKPDKEFNPFNESLSPTKIYTANVPGTIHTDLLSAKLIDGPYFIDNEKKLNWIHDNDWVYHTTFDFPESFNKKVPVKLVFEGLDSITEIWLNGKKVAETNNMFLKYVFDISQSIKTRNNKLKIIFKSPVNYSKSLEDKYGRLAAARNNVRVYLRKAQYSFGWDWGPSFPTMGIWRPVYLLQTEAPTHISVLFETLNISASKAKVKIRIFHSSDLESAKFIKVTLSNSHKTYNSKLEISGKGEEEIEFEVKNPDLWWPNGHGIQNLYDLQVSLTDDKGEILDKVKNKVGIRTIELQRKNKGKSVFRFVVNGKSIYIRGANWIPGDLFIPRIKSSTYKKLLKYARDANMNMLRVWGGGIYEEEIFYEMCDKLGFLIWQDFMFACAAYPENEDFLRNVKKEINYNVNRLQHHPSIAIWCGNNENEWIWFRDNNGPYTKMPGYKIFHELIPEMLHNLDPSRPYWPTTPFGDTDDPNDMLSGNQHSWDIWSRWVDYTEVKDDKSLFVTEFGFQAPANSKTLEKVLPKKNRKVQNEIFEFHNKQTEGPERLFRFLSAHFPVETKWEDFIYLTQLNQALALKTCLEHWRKRWPETSGSIIWQLNDCWPVTSWSLIDSELIPKISYYFVKNAFSDIMMINETEDDCINIRVHNFSNKKFNGNVKILLFKAGSGNILNEVNEPIEIRPYEQNDKIKIEKLPKNNDWVLVSSLYKKGNKDNIEARNFFAGKKWKHLTFAKAEINIDLMNNKKENNQLIIKTNKPAYFVDLYHPKVTFNERGFVLLPGEEKMVKASQKKFEKSELKNIRIFSVNQYLLK